MGKRWRRHCTNQQIMGNASEISGIFLRPGL